MAKLARKKGTQSFITHIFIQDSSSTTGAGLTGLTYASSSLACRYINAGGTLSGVITLQDITTLGTYEAPTANTNMRFKEVSSASPSQGVYEIHLHNDWMNLTGGSLVIMMAGATNMAQFRLEIDLQADANVTHVAGTAQTAGDLAVMITAVDDFVDTEVAAIKSDTAAILIDTAEIGVAGAGLTAIAVGVGGIQAASFAAGAIDAAAAAADFTTELTAGIRIKKNVALSNFPFLMVSSIDHITPKTGLTITATRSIDGAAFAACANAATEVANGFYKINLANTDLNGDTIAFKFTGGATADDRLLTIITTV